MANPSIIGGTGAGTEVLRRSYALGAAATTRTLLTGVANHLYTIITVLITNHTGTTGVFDMYIDPDGSTEKAYLCKQISLKGYETFVFNDKVVMDGTGDDLIIITNDSREMKCHCSYIDQTFA